MFTYDRGSNVGIIALGRFVTEEPRALPIDVIVTNANFYLPLTNLTMF